MPRKTVRPKPLGDYIIINPENTKELKKGGIIIPDFVKTAGSILIRGSVEAVGRGIPGMPHQVKYKDIVMFPRNIGIEYEEDGHTYLLMRESDVYINV